MYYGALRGTEHRWLNLERYFQFIRKHDEIQQIKYFTARIAGPRAGTQATYLRALETRPLVSIVLGKFKRKAVRCSVTRCSFDGQRDFKVPEEKRTDVNIGLHMLDDAYRDRCDTFVVVSGDSDLVPAVDMVKQRFPKKKIVVYVPTRSKIRGAALELRNAADKHRDLPLAELRHAQFPASVPAEGLRPIEKPADW
jgi:uncharacterized LabA/DUF88 family protein